MYGVGEGTIHAMSLATDTTPGAPKIHSLGLFQPLSGRYLDIITNRVRADASPPTLATWLAAVDEIRTKGTVPAQLPEGLNAIVNPGNVRAVADADKIDPVQLAAKVPAGTPVLLTCSDTDSQAKCDARVLSSTRSNTPHSRSSNSRASTTCCATTPRQRRQPVQTRPAFSTAGHQARRLCHK